MHPKRLLSNVVWILRPKRFDDRDAFSEAVRDYHLSIVESDDHWKPDERVLAATTVQVVFECWQGEHQVEATLSLRTDDPQGFTTLELLHAIQQGVTDYLATNGGSLGDHCFFEGLSLRSAAGDAPIYDLDLGS